MFHSPFIRGSGATRSRTAASCRRAHGLVPTTEVETGADSAKIRDPRCAGLDVHKVTVVACKRIVEQIPVRGEVKTFGATTGALYELF